MPGPSDHDRRNPQIGAIIVFIEQNTGMVMDISDPVSVLMMSGRGSITGAVLGGAILSEIFITNPPNKVLVGGFDVPGVDAKHTKSSSLAA